MFVATMSAGVCRTTDSGATWITVSSGLPTGTNNFPQTLRSIAINPSTPTTLLVGTQSGIYRSTDNGATWALAGATGAEVGAVEISPSTPATAYAITSLGAFKSLDSGATWLPANAGLPSSVDDEGFLTIDPSDPNVVYVVADTVYKTSNGGTLWATSNSGLGSPFFFSNVLVDPNTPNTIYVNAIGGSGLSRSTNGGTSWTSLNPTGLPDIPAFGVTGVSQVMFFEPGSSTNMFAGSPAGAYRSTNAGSAWTEITNNMTPQRTRAPGLQQGSGTGTASSLLAARRTINGGADILKLAGGLLPFTSLTSPFTANDSGGIESIVVDPTNPNIIYLLGGECALPYKSTDGGATWTQMSSGIDASHCGISLVIDPSNPSTLFVTMFRMGSGTVTGVYKSTNGGTSWTASSTGINGSVNHVAISPSNSSLVYAGSGGQVYKTTNGGGSWSNSSSGLPFGSGQNDVRRVAIDPTNDSIVYAATRGGVYQSTNAASSWTARTTAWPTINGVPFGAGAVAIDPATPTTLLASPATPANGPTGFLGFEARGIGLYRSTDSGATWTIEPGAIGGAIVNDIVFDGNLAIFASTNNGVFKFAAALPTMSIDKSSLVFSAVSTGAAFTSQTTAQAVRLTQTGAGTVSWTASSSQPWLVVSPTSGSGSATLNISVQFVSGLAASQSGSITLTFTGAGNTAGPISITLNTIATTAAAAPFGSFDTPMNGATGVTGSVGVTGWGVDDVEISRVRILRDPVAPEPAGALIFIGDAVLVDGARPDIQATYPNLPRSSRAGWGYLMLSNFLPNLGNGTFNLYAIMEDVDGHTTTLGPITITCTNSAATAPFGAIDTPIQGGTASGMMTNFGWVLGPNPRRADPPGGGTVRIAIDGAFIANVPGGWTSRPDLSALFPAAQYPGINTALGVAAVDTTAYSNGVHAIAWVVTDNLGSASGIGSRYFTVSNGALMLDPSSVSSSRRQIRVIAGNAFMAPPPASLLRSSMPEDVVVTGRRGFDEHAPLQTYAVRDGRVTVQSEEMDRIELRLASASAPGGYVGFLRVGGALAPLPVGSALDVETGEFTWQPGVAFVGTYDLVFARMNGGIPVERREVRVVLNPKGSNRVGTQTVIDIANGNLVAGWAADLDSQVDGGVDTVHVWAYPVDGSDPIFIGPAAFGGKRPDVAAIYGERFGESGYGIRLDALPPGTYNIAVFAYSTVAGRFAPAKTARVVIGR